jgi:head-tail adaptor
MSFESMLTDSLVIERSAVLMLAGTPPVPLLDDYGQPVSAWSTLASVAGLIQPRTATEVALQSQGGATLTDTVIYLLPRDVLAADRIRRASEATGPYYEISGVRDAAGHGHHLELDARRVA